MCFFAIYNHSYSFFIILLSQSLSQSLFLDFFHNLSLQARPAENKAAEAKQAAILKAQDDAAALKQGDYPIILSNN